MKSQSYSVPMFLFLLLAMLGLQPAFAAPPDDRGGGKPGSDDSDPTAPLPSYSIQFLGAFEGGSSSQPRSINSDGDIVGEAEAVAPAGWPSEEIRYAFLNVFNSSTGKREMINLHDELVREGFIAGIDFDSLSGERALRATAINAVDVNSDKENDLVQIVVSVSTFLDGTHLFSSSYRYTPAWTHPSGSLVPSEFVLIGNEFSVSNGAINSLGEVAGSDYSTASDIAATWNEVNGLQLIGASFSVENYGIDINEAGQVVGRTSNVDSYGWRYTPGQGFFNIPSLYKNGLPVPRGMNNSGDVLFSELTSKGWRSYSRTGLYTDTGGSIDLGTLGGDYALPGALNNLSHVVGESEREDGSTALFFYTKETGIYDLEAQIVDLPSDLSGKLFTFAQLAMNDSDWVVGTTETGRQAYLISPTE